MSKDPSDVVGTFSSYKQSFEKKKSIKDELLTMIEDNNRKIDAKKKIYKKILYDCIKLIKIENNEGKTEMLFEVDIQVATCEYYDYTECLEYIKNKLIASECEVVVISDISILISWKALSDKKNKRL